MTQRKIIHVDMDCFYAAVEVKYRPELKGLPLGIGGPANSRSVLCTASYEARKFGVRSAMPSSQAVRLCPQLVLLPPNFELYKKESRAIRQIFARFTPRIEPLSLDEAYLDVTGSSHCGGSATLIAQEIRSLIAKELQLPASAGIAPNKFLAKIASDWKKPNGQFVIRPEDIEGFVRDLPVEKIRGVGKVTAQKLHQLGLQTCGDIQKKDVFQLAKWFGSWGAELFDLSRGIDNRPVAARSERKSLTVEETFAKDLQTLEQCRGELPGLFESWQSQMQRANLQDRLRGIVVKVKYADFKSTTHEMSTKLWPTENDFQMLLEHIWQKRSDPVRLIGLGARLATKSSEPSRTQLSLFLEADVDQGGDRERPLGIEVDESDLDAME